MKHGPGYRRLDVVPARCRKIYATVTVAAYIVRTHEGLARAVFGNRSNGFSTSIEFHQIIAVVARHHNVVAVKVNQSIGATMLPAPPYSRTLAIPCLDVTGRIFHIEQSSLIPEGSLRIVRVRIDDIDFGTSDTPTAEPENQQYTHQP